MSATAPATSSRRAELLELAYRYVLEHGVAAMSLRPLAAAIGSSPRVLLFLFGSKEALVRELLARAREEELALLQRVRTAGAGEGELIEAAAELWGWLSAEEHRGLLTLWVEGYARSLTGGEGPWDEFAQTTVAEWLGVLADLQPPRGRRTAAARAERTLVLAVLRGAMLDLLATGEVRRTTDAVNRQLALMRSDR